LVFAWLKASEAAVKTATSFIDEAAEDELANVPDRFSSPLRLGVKTEYRTPGRWSI
jgi:hypothetical protein